jgi:hypothetical protein
MLPNRRHLVLLPLAALIAVLPLILFGCSCGHDFDFHIISWFEAATQFAHGTLHPHWADTPAWSAGEPRFVFYPPLSWSIGGLLGLILPWTWTPIAYTWLALTAAGLSLHYVVRSFASSNAALIAATLYIVNPYTLYTVYERSAYAELLAAAWLPLLLYAFLRERITIRSIAVPVALLWLTNAPAAVMGCYAAAFLAALRILLALRDRTFPHVLFTARAIAGTLLGLGLAAFYIIPAAYERRFVQIALAVVPGLSPQDNFLFRHTTDPDHDAVLRTASLLALVLIALTTAVLVLVQLHSIRTRADGDGRTDDDGAITPRFPMLLAALAAAIVFMLTPLSAVLWDHLPQMHFLQFPWRLLAVLAVIFGFGIALLFSRVGMQASVIAIAGAALFTAPAYIAFHQRCYPEDTLPERLAIFRSANPGTDPTDEYTPATGDNDVLAQTNPGYWMAQDPAQQAPSGSRPGAAPRLLELSLPVPQVLILNLRDYPAWSIRSNEESITARLHRDDGLIAIPLPAGRSRIQIRYITGRDQSIGYLISSLSLLLLTILVARTHGGPGGA